MPHVSRRTCLALAAALPLAACAAAPPPPPAQRLPVTLADAFSGRTRGRGVFSAPIVNSERRFTADLAGRLEGGRLTVVEDFVYDDGQTERLTWVFTRTGPGTWDGRREDTVGTAKVVEDGSVIRLSYTADIRSPSGVTRLGFSDVIYRRPDGLIVNDGVVSRFGIPIGTVRFELRRH
ncbi:MAG: DUF3833 domain-containing protein [Rhodobacteraceae bacterium]|nr:DUF3833 domain-containing protein [Paracoccaceae bacterium]